MQEYTVFGCGGTTKSLFGIEPHAKTNPVSPGPGSFLLAALICGIVAHASAEPQLGSANDETGTALTTGVRRARFSLTLRHRTAAMGAAGASLR